LKRSAYSEAVAHLDKAVAIADGLADGSDRTIDRLHLQIAYGRALRGSLGHSAHETVAAWKRARQFAADINDPAELVTIHSGLFNASLTHGELAPMRVLAETIMSTADRQSESPVAAVVAHWTSGVTCWFGGDYLNARVHLERALAIYGAEPDPAAFKAATQDLPAVIMRFLALVLWPLGSIDRSRQLAREAVRVPGEKRALVQVNALVHKAVFDGLCGGMLEETDRVLALAREHAMPLYVAAGTHLSGLARWRAGDRINGLAEMRRGWALLHENDCYLCEPFWGMQVAVANAEVGQIETALDTLMELIAWVEQSGQHWLDAELHRVRGELLLRCDSSNASSAEGAFKRALEIARRQQTKTFELRGALGLARLYRTIGCARLVPDVLAPALVDFDTAQDLPEIEEAGRLLNHPDSAKAD
jgi:tetratricopeptide (TPR) repeat protein